MSGSLRQIDAHVLLYYFLSQRALKLVDSVISSVVQGSFLDLNGLKEIFMRHAYACLQGNPLPYGFDGTSGAKILGKKAEVVELLLATD